MIWSRTAAVAASDQVMRMPTAMRRGVTYRLRRCQYSAVHNNSSASARSRPPIQADRGSMRRLSSGGLCSEVWNPSEVRMACRKTGTLSFDGFQCTLIAFTGSLRLVVKKGLAPFGRSSTLIASSLSAIATMWEIGQRIGSSSSRKRYIVL